MKLRRMSRGQVSYLKAALVSRLEPEFLTKAVAEQTASYSTVVTMPSPTALRLLEVAASDWFRPITEVYDAAGFHPDEAEHLVDELKTCGYVTLHPVRTFRRGGQMKLLLPTGKAIEVLREARIRCSPIRGDAPHGEKGDATHIFYQNIIARWLRKKEWTVEIEQTLKSKRVDVGAIRGPALHAYEVVNEGLEKELSNLKLDLQDGWIRIVFCVGNEDIRQDLTALISNRIGDQVFESVDFRLLPGFR